MAAPTARLEALLRAMGLSFELGFTTTGSPYAVIRIAAEGGAEPLGVSASVQGPVLRLTAHELRRAPLAQGRLARMNEIHERWPWGRIYYNLHHDCEEASVGLWLGSDRILPTEQRLLLDHLVEAALCWRRDEPPPEFAPEPPAGVLPPGALAALLAEAGFPATPLHGGEVLALRLHDPEGQETFVDFFRSGAFLVVRGMPPASARSPADERTWRVLQELNQSLELGAAIFSRAEETVYWAGAVPLAFGAIDAALCRWLVDLAADTARAIRVALRR